MLGDAVSSLNLVVSCFSFHRYSKVFVFLNLIPQRLTPVKKLKERYQSQINQNFGTVCHFFKVDSQTFRNDYKISRL